MTTGEVNVFDMKQNQMQQLDGEDADRFNLKVIGFEAAQCKNCYKCVRGCAVKAIEVKNGQAQIITNQCILCGRCMDICPQSAKKFVSDLEKVKDFIQHNDHVIASLAPSYMVALDHAHPGQVVTALKKLGFTQVRETAEAATYVTEEYARLIKKGEMKNIITTCCPSANELVEIHHPEMTKYLAPVVSPMIAHGKMLHEELGDNMRVVFIGPCIAKKKEAEIDSRTSGYVDAVIDFVELESWLQEANIDLQQCEPSRMDNRNPQVNRLYPVTGGVLSALNAAAGKHKYQTISVHGLENCIALLESMEQGELENCVVEMSVCRGSCIEGPAIAHHRYSRFRKKLIVEELVGNETKQPKDYPEKSQGYFYKEFCNRAQIMPVPTEAQIREILRKIGKNSEKDELNCTACGYPSCREKAIAVYQGKAELTMCMPYMQEQARSLAKTIMDKSPDAIIAVDADMNIVEFSKAAETCFGKQRLNVMHKPLGDVMQDDDFKQVYQTHENIYGKKVYDPQSGLYTLQDIIYMEEQDSVMGLLQNITVSETKKRQQYALKLETVEMAQNVIDKQMMVAQQIASLLGETTAETKVSLTKLRKMMLADQDDMERR